MVFILGNKMGIVSTSNFILPNSGPYNDLILKFPVTLGKTDEYTYYHHNTSSATTYQGLIKITPDAIGTLITPFATYTNAYRIHRQINSSNCLTSLGCHWYSTTTESLEWFAPGVHGVLLSVNSSTTSHRAHGGMPVEFTYSKWCEVYRDPSNPLGTNTYYEEPYQFHFQNPVSNKLEITVCSSDISQTKIDIYDLNGKILISAKGQDRQRKIG